MCYWCLKASFFMRHVENKSKRLRLWHNSHWEFECELSRWRPGMLAAKSYLIDMKPLTRPDHTTAWSGANRVFKSCIQKERENRDGAEAELSRVWRENRDFWIGGWAEPSLKGESGFLKGESGFLNWDTLCWQTAICMNVLSTCLKKSRMG